MRILLTGGTGFIGSYVLRFLLEGGHHVNALVRNPSKLPEPRHSNLHVVAGDLTDAAARRRSLEGCDAVVHLAALVGLTANYPSEFVETNIQSTESLLYEAQEKKIGKFVFASSLSSHTIRASPLANEESLEKPGKYFCKYSETKGLAEELVLKRPSGLPYVIVYPCRVFGIGPLTDANGATKALHLYLKNRLPFLVEGGGQYSCWAFVEDVARGIVAATTSDLSNQRYILGGENKTLAEVYNLVDTISGKKHLQVRLSSKHACGLASALELQAKFLGRKPLITREWLETLLESQRISSQKAICALNYRITPFQTAFEKTINWLQTLHIKQRCLPYLHV